MRMIAELGDSHAVNCVGTLAIAIDKLPRFI